MGLSNEIVTDIAKELGFDLVGFAAAGTLEKEGDLLEKWLSLGYHADMKYMERNLDKRKDVKVILPSAQSVISLALIYHTPEKHSNETANGKISRYAWGKDYHLIIWEKLDKLIEELKKLEPAFEAKSYVDTGPVMDKAWAVRSGIGWMGKHTNVINRETGSWFFIANVICNYKFSYALPSEDFCGSCTACIEACPTGAIVSEYVLDANKCISYLTIENKEEIPSEFKGKFENWIYGCDICQDVCPWNNKFSKITSENDFYPQNGNKEISVAGVLTMDQEEFSRKFQKSAVKRTKLKGLRRNAAFILED
ncbi:MAG: tRNA epoxyqueuosine(34) reductase QueG [Ignavibacteriaceae bacterium]